MPNENIENAFNENEIKEDQTKEFKTSVFFDPGTHQPGMKQMRTIAETMAAFMNADGGFLILGLADNKVATGIEGDLDVLAHQPETVVLHTSRHNDTDYVYGGTKDKFELKVRAIAKAFLSPNAQPLVGDFLYAPVEGKTVCKITIKKCAETEFVYSHCKYGPQRPEIAEIFVRFGNQKRKLEGAERDEFVRKRTRAQVMANVNAVMAQNPAGLIDQVLAAINQAFNGQPQVVGNAFVVDGAVALDDPNFAALESPRGLVFDGQHVCDVKGWKGAYLALVEKLNALDPARFDALPEDQDLKKYFIVPVPHKKYPGYATAKFGTNSNVRAKEVSGKAHFINPDDVVHKLLAFFNIERARVALRG